VKDLRIFVFNCGQVGRFIATVLLVIYENDCLIAGSDEKIGEVIKPLKRFYFLCQR
jgi:hypothetical protein